MTLRDLSDEAVAADIGRTRETVSRIRRRKVRPDWDTIQLLRQWSKDQITAADFEQLQVSA